MHSTGLKLNLFLLFTTLCSIGQSFAQNDKEHIEVALRMVGHELLLQANDSASRVLPIAYDKGKFIINFESEFHFEPGRLASSVDRTFEIAKIRDHYRLEVEDVDQSVVVYSYESAVKDDLKPCFSRIQPKSNYRVLFTFLNDLGEPIEFDATPIEGAQNEAKQQSSSVKGLISLLISLGILLGVGAYFWRVKKRSKENAGSVQIGKYRFDQRNMKLIFKKESIDLTSKETDLLSLLHSSMDVTIEREEILKVVWGDEGDYVGRTLDVFISKLRKKFAEDANVRIVNVRGVGYKLMLSA